MAFAKSASFFLSAVVLSMTFVATADAARKGSQTPPPVKTPFKDYSLDGPDPSTFFGFSLAGGVDVSGDGKADLLVGSGYSYACNPECPTGHVYIYSADDGHAVGGIDFAAGEDSFGHAIALADVTGDGTADIIVGAPFSHNWDGVVRVYEGRTFNLLYSFTGDAGDLAGWSVAANDFNNDGHADIVIGAPSTGQPFSVHQNGRVYIYSGADGSLLGTLDGEAFGDAFGTSVAIADLNAAGPKDILVGAVGADFGAANSGSVYGFSARRAQLFRIDGTNANEQFGAALTAMADVNGDGREDFIASATSTTHSDPTAFGRLTVYSGATHTALYTVDARSGNYTFGYNLTATGDFNGDGIADFFAGDPCYQVPGTYDCRGRADLISGANGSAIGNRVGESVDDRYASGVVSLGDLNGDGLSEISISASSHNTTGAVGVYSGAGFVGSSSGKGGGTKKPAGKS